MTSKKNKNAGGRPPKFCEARHPITVTIPDRILQKMQSVSPDRAQAIVKCVEAVTGKKDSLLKPVELITVEKGKALIVVGPSRALRQIDWLRMVEISPARYLLVLPSGMSVDSLEVAILDLIENIDSSDREEMFLLKELRALIGNQRRGKSISKAELVFVDVP